MDFAPYRFQMTAIDLFHLFLVFAVYVIQLWLCAKFRSTQDHVYVLAVPFFTAAMVGIIIRMDTMVHRIGGFLKAHGDPWEIAKAMHRPTQYLMPIGDVQSMIPALVFLIYAEYQAFLYFAENWRMQAVYIIGTLLLVAWGVSWWIVAVKRASTGF